MSIPVLKIKLHCNKAVDLYKKGQLRKSIIENRKAMVLVDKCKKVLLENEAIYECQDFLRGDSNITRKPKI